MVNRRLLRIKAMKAIYAYKIGEQAEYELASDTIAEAYQPDLNSMNPTPKAILEGQRQLAQIELDEKLGRRPADSNTDVPLSIRKLVNEVHLNYTKKNKSYQNSLSKNVVAEVENLYNTYIQILLIFPKLAELAQLDEQNRLLKTDLANYGQFAENSLLKTLENSEELTKKRITLNADWKTSHLLVIRQYYQDVLRSNPQFVAYCTAKSHSLETDKAIISYIVKEHFFKEGLLRDYFQERDLHWAENSATLRSLVLKTFQIESLTDFKLQKLAYNWDDDRDFFIELFKKTLENDNEYEAVILSNVLNWDMERLASLDTIILKMALTELVNFPSIPVKVTINEYIELAKTYSTPQSGKFVNGLLEAIAKQWQDSGTILKTGRGLIDNR
jgi:transcription antitermination protein NusB